MKLPKSIFPGVRNAESPASSPRPSHQTEHTWVRWYYRSHFVFYGLLVLLTSASVIGSTRSWEYLVATVVLALLLGVWHWFTLFRHPQWAQENPLPVLAYFVVAVPLYVGLVWIDPALPVPDVLLLLVQLLALADSLGVARCGGYDGYPDLAKRRPG